MTEDCLISGRMKWNWRSKVSVRKTIVSTTIAYLAMPNTPPNSRLRKPRWIARSNRVTSFPTILMNIATARKSSVYATTSQTALGHVNCAKSQAENGAAHNLAPTQPSTTAKMAMSSVTSPRIRPLTSPTSSGSKMTTSNQLIFCIFILYDWLTRG